MPIQIPCAENHTITLNGTPIYQGYSFETSVAVSKADISKFATLLQTV